MAAPVFVLRLRAPGHAPIRLDAGHRGPRGRRPPQCEGVRVVDNGELREFAQVEAALARRSAARRSPHRDDDLLSGLAHPPSGQMERRNRKARTMDMRQYSGSEFVRADDVRAGPVHGTILSVQIGKFNRPVAELDNGFKSRSTRPTRAR